MIGLGSLPGECFARGLQFVPLPRQLRRFVGQSSGLAVNVGAKLLRIGLGVVDLGDERFQLLRDLRFELPEALALSLDIVVPSPALFTQPAGDIVGDRCGGRRFGDVFFHGVATNNNSRTRDPFPGRRAVEAWRAPTRTGAAAPTWVYVTGPSGSKMTHSRG